MPSHMNRLKIPTFDLIWFQLNDKYYVCLPGGGGSAKSGVKNQLLIATHIKNHEYSFLDGYLTDSPSKSALCSGVSCGFIGDSPALCALVDNSCLLLQVGKYSESSNLMLSRRLEFVADFSAVESGVNCSIFTRSCKLVTGGEDFVCRVWAIKVEHDNEWTVESTTDLKGHTAPIMSLSEHCNGKWVCSASKDGTAKIWDTESMTLLLTVSLADGISGGGSAATRQLKLECRGACFSPCGNFLFTIQSARRGATQLIKWQVVQNNETLELIPALVKTAAPVPTTRLRINDTGTYVAVGASDGSVTVFNAENLNKVQGWSQHDLPVTGLGFAPQSLSQLQPVQAGTKALLVSCSADNRMITMQVKDKSTKLIISLLLIVGAVLLSVWALSGSLLKHWFAVFATVDTSTH